MSLQDQSSTDEASTHAKQQRELAKRRKEVEEREAAVDARELRLDSGQHDLQHELRMLEGRLSARQSELDQISNSLKERYDKQEDELKDIKRRRDSSEAATIAAEGLAKQRTSELSELTMKIKDAGKRLRTMAKEEQERKDYLKEQESVIDQTIKAGNEAIADVNREVATLEREKEELLAQKFTIQADLNSVVEQVSAANDTIYSLKERYELAVVKYRADLATIRDEVAAAEKRKADIDRDIDAKLLDYKTKEREMTIQRDVLNRKSEEVEAERRKVESKRALYGY